MELFFPGVAELVVDFRADELIVRMDDGCEERESSAGSGSTPHPSDPVTRATHRLHDKTVVIETTWGDVIEVEQYEYDNQAQRRNDRPTVYLDQNKWVQVAQAVHTPGAIESERERTAATELGRRARSREVILLLSSGHWLETGPTYGGRRTTTAATMVDLSRGWLLRDPMQVRELELQALFRSRSGHSYLAEREVVTLDYRALFSGLLPVPGDQHLPPVMRAMSDALSGSQAVLATLLADERVEGGAAPSAAWAQAHQGFAGELAAASYDRAGKRRKTLQWAMRDLGHQLVGAAVSGGLSEEALDTWQTTADDSIGSLPYIGRWREVVHRRLSNSQNRWERNDLVDLLFLPCAAAYADHVVCERKTGGDLRAIAPRFDGGAAVHFRIEELLDALDAV